MKCLAFTCVLVLTCALATCFDLKINQGHATDVKRAPVLIPVNQYRPDAVLKFRVTVINIPDGADELRIFTRRNFTTVKNESHPFKNLNTKHSYYAPEMDLSKGDDVMYVTMMTSNRNCGTRAILRVDRPNDTSIVDHNTWTTVDAKWIQTCSVEYCNIELMWDGTCDEIEDRSSDDKSNYIWQLPKWGEVIIKAVNKKILEVAKTFTGADRKRPNMQNPGIEENELHKINETITISCAFDKRDSPPFEWYQQYYDGITRVSLPKEESEEDIIKYNVQLTLNDFDNDTRVGCISAQNRQEPSTIVITGDIPQRPHDYPLLDYGNKIYNNYNCDKNTSNIYITFMGLITDNGLEIIKSLNDLTVKENGTIFTCIYFIKSKGKNKLTRYVTNTRLLFYNEMPNTSTLGEGPTGVPDSNIIVAGEEPAGEKKMFNVGDKIEILCHSDTNPIHWRHEYHGVTTDVEHSMRSSKGQNNTYQLILELNELDNNTIVECFGSKRQTVNIVIKENPTHRDCTTLYYGENVNIDHNCDQIYTADKKYMASVKDNKIKIINSLSDLNMADNASMFICMYYYKSGNDRLFTRYIVNKRLLIYKEEDKQMPLQIAIKATESRNIHTDKKDSNYNIYYYIGGGALILILLLILLLILVAKNRYNNAKAIITKDVAPPPDVKRESVLNSKNALYAELELYALPDGTLRAVRDTSYVDLANTKQILYADLALPSSQHTDKDAVHEDTPYAQITNVDTGLYAQLDLPEGSPTLQVDDKPYAQIQRTPPNI